MGKRFSDGEWDGVVEHFALSEREAETLALLLDDRETKEIADTLGVGYSTARTYISRVFGKLHVNRRTAAITRTFDAHLQLRRDRSPG